jgi:hypothetical protein
MANYRDIILGELGKDNPKFKSQAELYEYCKIPQQTYFKILERNSTKVPTLKIIADALDIDVEIFLRDDRKKIDSSTNSIEYWKRKYEDSYRTNIELTKTITNLALGKRRGVMSA